jgi:hypothetical protein
MRITIYLIICMSYVTLCNYIAYNIGFWASWGIYVNAPWWPAGLLAFVLAIVLALLYPKAISKSDVFKRDALVYLVLLLLVLPIGTSLSSSYYFEKGHNDRGMAAE